MGIELSVADLGSANSAHSLGRSAMMKHSATLTDILLLGVAMLGGALPGSAQTADEMIARARAYLGGEAALAAVNSVHFIGVLEPGSATPAGARPEKLVVEIICQKPYQQRIVITGAGSIETTALDGSTAWEGEQEGRDPNQRRLNVLRPDQVKQLQANTWENLNFYKDIERRGGAVAVLGSATVDGQPAVKLVFTHDVGIVCSHYFNPDTGRLLLTETEQGLSIREEGEIVVGGVRFPRKVIQTTKSLDSHGQPVEQKLILSFDKITLNETFPESDFELPLVSLSSPAPVNPGSPAPVGKPPNPPSPPGPAGK
jgi:hypothetical protein